MIEFTFCFVRDIHTTSTCDFLQERFLKNYFFGINEEDNLTKNPKKISPSQQTDCTLAKHSDRSQKLHVIPCLLYNNAVKLYDFSTEEISNYSGYSASHVTSFLKQLHDWRKAGAAELPYEFFLSTIENDTNICSSTRNAWNTLNLKHLFDLAWNTETKVYMFLCWCLYCSSTTSHYLNTDIVFCYNANKSCIYLMRRNDTWYLIYESLQIPSNFNIKIPSFFD